MKVQVRKLSEENLFREACESTLSPGKLSRLTLGKMFQCEHSPIRVLRYWLKIEDIKTFISVHLVRHKHGIEHFVQSKRDDRGGGDVVTRETLIQHGADVNAQALINISRKRLCLNSHRETVATWTKVRKAIGEIEPELLPFLVPECVYRNGLCPEIKPCQSGPTAVCSAYPPWPGTRAVVELTS